MNNDSNQGAVLLLRSNLVKKGGSRFVILKATLYEKYAIFVTILWMDGGKWSIVDYVKKEQPLKKRLNL